jgi:molecular chaperone GrpE (heat shock protein)
MTDDAETPSPTSSSGEEEPEASEADPLEQAKAEATKYKDMALRSAADFDNYRDRKSVV